MNPFPSSSQPDDEHDATVQGNGRHVKHMKNACFNCRSVRKRCIAADNLRCERCIKNGFNCIFPNPEDDGRAKRDRNTIKELRALVASLREKLKTERETDPHFPQRRVTMDKLTAAFEHTLVFNPVNIHFSYGPPGAHHLSISLESSPKLATAPQLPPAEATPPTGPPASGLQWSRYLPDDFTLSEQTHNELVGLFFDGFAFWGLRGHRPSFESAMREALSGTTTATSRSAHYGAMLHNAMLAVAMAFSLDPRLNNLEARLKFVKKAQSYALEEMETPTLSGVLAFSYLSSFFSGIGERSPAATYFGVCAAMSQDLGLGLDTSKVSSSFMSDREKNERDWLYWVIFCQDKCLGLHLGRPTRIPRPKHPRVPALSHEEDGYKVAMFRSHVTLDLLGTKVLETVYYRKRVAPDEMIQIFQEVEAWNEAVPAHWRVPDRIEEHTPYGRCQLMLFLTHAWIKLCVHQPFYRKVASSLPCISWTAKAIAESDHAAARILDLFHVYDRLHKLHQIPVCAVSIAFLAGAIFIYQVERMRGSKDEHLAVERLQQIMEVLSRMEQTWQCAAKQREVLQKYNRRVNPEQAALTSLGSSIPAVGQTPFVDANPASQTESLSDTQYLPSQPAREEPNAISAMTTGRGSSTLNPPRSDSVMDVDLGLPPEFFFLFPDAGTVSSSTGSMLFDFGAFETGHDYYPTSPCNTAFLPPPDPGFQRQPGATMSFCDSPSATTSVLSQFGPEETVLSAMGSSFASSSGSTSVGRISPQVRAHLPSLGDTRAPLHGLTLERASGSGRGRGNSIPRSPRSGYSPFVLDQHVSQK